jgi:hypothetical protein
MMKALAPVSGALGIGRGAAAAIREKTNKNSAIEEINRRCMMILFGFR